MSAVVTFRGETVIGDLHIEQRFYARTLADDQERYVGSLHLTIGEWQCFGCALLMGGDAMTSGLARPFAYEPDETIDQHALAALDKRVEAAAA